MKTRRFVVAFLLAIALVIVGCAPAAEETPAAEEVMVEPKTIAYVMWNLNNPWQVTLRDAIKAVVESHGDNYLEADPGTDPAKQLTQMETFIGQGVDGIVLTPTDSAALLPAVKAANDAGIPVVIAGAGIDEGDWKAAILTDNFAAGKQIGDYVVEKLGGEGKVVASNVPGILDADERQAGWEAAFEGTNIEILEYQIGGTVEAGVTNMENWLQKYGEEIKAVMGINDPTALGALTVIEEAGLEDKIFVVGVDAADEALQAMKDCRAFGATAAQDPAQMGTTSANLLYDILAGKSVSERVQRIATQLHTLEDYCVE